MYKARAGFGLFPQYTQIGDYYWSSVKGGKWIYLSFLLGLHDDIFSLEANKKIEMMNFRFAVLALYKRAK